MGNCHWLSKKKMKRVAVVKKQQMNLSISVH